MSQVLLITGLESLLLLVLVAIALFINWRKKQHKTQDFNQLADDIQDRQPNRLNQLKRRLLENSTLAADSEEISEQLITAEKLFLQQFIEQQMQQQPISGFYENLCELLDSYLFATLKNAEKTNENATPAHEEEIPENTEDSSADTLESDTTSEITEENAQTEDDEAQKPAEKTSESEEDPPSWGDVFD